MQIKQHLLVAEESTKAKQQHEIALEQMEASVAKLEAEKITRNVLQKAELEKLHQHISDLKLQNHDNEQAHEKKFREIQADLEAHMSSNKETAIRSEQQHALNLAGLQSSFEKQLSELNLRLQASNCNGCYRLFVEIWISTSCRQHKLSVPGTYYLRATL